MTNPICLSFQPIPERLENILPTPQEGDKFAISQRLRRSTVVEPEKGPFAVLEAEIAAIKKNSRNSSKPPSSDLVKPPKAPKSKGQGKLKRGAQPGHPQNLRKPLAPEWVDEIVKLELTVCPDCGHKLDLVQGETKITQPIELVEKPFFATEPQQLMYWCKPCQCWHSLNAISFLTFVRSFRESTATARQ